jgi:hypothetical protein
MKRIVNERTEELAELDIGWHVMPDNANLRRELPEEVDRLAAKCRKKGFEHAARYLTEKRTEVVEIAMRARLEPKRRDLPSPFVYSMQ